MKRFSAKKFQKRKQMKFIVYKQYPKSKSKKGIQCALSLDKKQTCLFDENEHLIDLMEKPEIIFINPHGLMLRGFEENGCDKTGRIKYNYQEWYCAFLVGGEK